MPTATGADPAVNPEPDTLLRDQVIPVIAETLRVEKRLVETGRAQVHLTVSEQDRTVETLLMRQDVTVERVPIGRQVEAAPPTRREGDTLVVPVMEEVVVVEKRLILKEELRIRIDETRHLDTQTVHLRTEHADITLDGAAAETTASPIANPRSKP